MRWPLIVLMSPTISTSEMGAIWREALWHFTSGQMSGLAWAAMVVTHTSKSFAKKGHMRVKLKQDYQLLGSSHKWKAGMVYPAQFAESQPDWEKYGKVFVFQQDDKSGYGASLLVQGGDYEIVQSIVGPLTGQCQWEGCYETATHIACGRWTCTGNGGHQIPGCYCKAHAQAVADEAYPEYTEECPNCGCKFGVH